MNDFHRDRESSGRDSDQPFHRYADPLAWLDVEPDPLSSLIRDAAAKLGWAAPAAKWLRVYSNFTPQRVAFCMFVYEAPASRPCLIELFALRAAALTGEHGIVIETPAGWIKLLSLANDPVLRTLESTLAQYPSAQVLRYRPYRRCTLRVQKNGAAPFFVKVYGDDLGASVYQTAVAIWEAKIRGDYSFNVAPPLRWDAQARSVLLGQVPGEPILPQLLSVDGPILAERMGRACAELAVSSVVPAHEFGALAQMTRTRAYAQELQILLPKLSERINALLERLSELHHAIVPRVLKPIHGSPHAHQWLQQGATLGLVDFDRFGFGDPELDVATFLGEMDFVRSDQAPVAEISRAFQRGYESIYGPLNSQLIAAYRTHKRLAKVRRAAYRPSPKSPDKALRHLLRAEACIEEIR